MSDIVLPSRNVGTHPKFMPPFTIRVSVGRITIGEPLCHWCYEYLENCQGEAGDGCDSPYDPSDRPRIKMSVIR